MTCTHKGRHSGSKGPAEWSGCQEARAPCREARRRKCLQQVRGTPSVWTNVHILCPFWNAISIRMRFSHCGICMAYEKWRHPNSISWEKTKTCKALFILWHPSALQKMRPTKWFRVFCVDGNVAQRAFTSNSAEPRLLCRKWTAGSLLWEGPGIYVSACALTVESVGDCFSRFITPETLCHLQRDYLFLGV